MRLALEVGEEVDAAVSVALGQAPQVLPFGSDLRARSKLALWLRKHGVGGDLGRLGNARLCQTVLMRWLRDRGDVQVYQAGERLVAALADRITARADDHLTAIARLVLLIADVGFEPAVRDMMADEIEERSQADDYDPFDLSGA